MRIMLWQVKCYDWRGIHLINFVSNFYHERKKQVPFPGGVDKVLSPLLLDFILVSTFAYRG
jgi:hypothetical protein